MPEEKTISTSCVYNGGIFDVRVDTVLTAEGRETQREIVEHCPCVAVIAVNGDGHIILVRQFRKAIEKDLLEIPAGGIEPGEDPESAVRRELQEEIGYSPEKIVSLGGLYSSPGFCTEYLYLYLATDLLPSRLYADDTPGIVTVTIRPEQVYGLINSGEICDSKSVAGLLYYLEYLNRRKDNLGTPV